jgi:ATP-dependent DNA helicase DinG
MDADALAILDAVVAALDGEQREGQRELTAAVADAITNGRHLLAEAPTGSGKSFAYLAAAIASGQRVVVATSTIALQSQLVDRDLPALQQHGGVDFTYAILKGRANYVCRAKLGAAAKPDALFEVPVTAAFPRQLERLNAFARASATGDRADIRDAINDASWAAVSCSSAECPGRTNCPEGDSCFAEVAREHARDKSILVVNHALYCTHLAAAGTVLPEHDVVIIDEAHAFPGSATNTFGVDLGAGALARLVPLLRRAAVEDGVVEAFATAAKSLEAAIEDIEGRVNLGDDERLANALLAAAERLATASGKLAQSDNDNAKRTGQLATARLDALRRLGAPGEDDVMWIEANGRAKRLRLAPVVVGERIAATMLAEHPAVAVSATLGGASPFAEFAQQFGLAPDTYDALLAPSSFDWRAQGMLYVGRDLPDPGRARAEWLADAGARLVQLVNAAGGRTLVLCTSRANVEHFATLLREHTDHDVLAQGDASVGHLSRTFLEEETSVLVGTRSFWQGIDTPGVSCVLVVIDRIPFPSPGEPLNAARRERAAAGGMNAFAAIDLPEAALVLAQGAGRLIRRRDDHGVVAVLDARLALRDYRRRLLQAVPPFRRTVDLEEVCSFLKETTAQRP